MIIPQRRLVSLVLDETISIDNEEDVLTEVTVDFSDALEGETGHLIVVIQPPWQVSDLWERRNQTIQTWLQVTQIGLDAFVDHSQVVVWATDLADGSPLADVSVMTNRVETATSASSVQAVSTDSSGLAQFDLSNNGTNLVIAQLGDDTAILPAYDHFWDDGGWHQRELYDEIRWHVFDDRAIYKPGEEVHLKGWVRHINGESGAISLLDGATELFYRVHGPQGNELMTDQIELNSFGGFDFNLTLPENSNLGYASIQFQLLGDVQREAGSDFYYNFQIQEFRRPEFEVNARQESTGPYLVNDAATLAVDANYFAGGGLPNAETMWWVNSTPSSYSPPNWLGFTFGTWTPWWFSDYGYGYDDYYEEEYFGGFP